MMSAISKKVLSQKHLIMNIALIGYGRMGHEIETIALRRGHVIKLIVDQDNTNDLIESNLKAVDVAIEFSFPDAAFDNIVSCLEKGVPVVSGTTGWLEKYQKVTEICKRNNAAFLHSTNFSIGVNILFKLNAELAKLTNRFNTYAPAIEEVHHIKKLDAPSGTAITLANGIVENSDGYDQWHNSLDKVTKSVPIQSIREGDVPGTHTVEWDSETDSISLKHVSKNRKGLALGAVIAAEFLFSRKGIFTMNDVMGF